MLTEVTLDFFQNIQTGNFEHYNPMTKRKITCTSTCDYYEDLRQKTGITKEMYIYQLEHLLKQSHDDLNKLKTENDYLYSLFVKYTQTNSLTPQIVTIKQSYAKDRKQKRKGQKFDFDRFDYHMILANCEQGFIPTPKQSPFKDVEYHEPDPDVVLPTEKVDIL